MTVVSKAGLAAELGITKARVSQYVQRGLPVRSDGKLNREEAVNWIAANYPNFGRSRAPGVNRASAIVRERSSRRPRLSAPVLDGLAEVIGGIGPIAREIGFLLGLDIKQTWMLEHLFIARIWRHAEDLIPGICLLEMQIDELIKVGERAWPGIARDRGEANFDADAWWDELDELTG